MKITKKVLSVVLAGAMTLAMSVAAFAATNVSSSEQKILDQAKLKAAALGVSEDNARYQQYYSQALTYVQTYDMTEEQVNGALTAMDEAQAKAETAMKEAGVSSVLDLDKDTLKSLSAKCADVIQAEFDRVGIQVQLSADGTVTVVKENVDNGNKTNEPVKNNTVFQSTSVVKQTGSDMTATVVVAVAVLGAVATCGVVAKKKGLFTEA